jgi:hypothetical protein
MRLYFDRLAPGGLLLLHVTNRYIHFTPVVAALAADGGFIARMRPDGATPALRARGAYPSDWAVLARKREDLGGIMRDRRWLVPVAEPGALWTDDYSNVVRRLR